MSIKISVIIPGYKTPPQVWERCVLSVLDAIGPNDEIICVDDGTPGGVPILSDMMKKDCRIQVVVQSNSGLSAARNAGMAVAKGEFISFVDSDDEVCSTIFNECLNSLSSTGADIALYGVKVIWTTERLTKDDVPPAEIKGLLTPDNVKKLSDKCLFNYVWNKVYRKKILEENRILFNRKGMPCEDVAFNLECVIAKAKWVMVDKVGYIYYRTGGTLLSQYRPFNSEGLYIGMRAWEKYAQTSEHADKLFFKKREVFDNMVAWAQWDNIWRLNSTYSLRERLQWLQVNKHSLLKQNTGIKTVLLKISPIYLMGYQLVYSFLRRYFYFKFIRRWHLRRLYPQVKEIKE